MPKNARPWNPTWTLIGASLAVMMAFLDALVVTTALPTLRSTLHSSLSGLEWTINAYNLAFACMLLTGAALGDRFGRRRTFCAGLGLFLVASLVAGSASTVDLLIVARAVQGVGAAVMVPLTLTLIVEASPPQRQALAIGVWSSGAALSGASGPIVGGLLLQAASWHWIFWVNVPVGLAVLAIATFRFRESYGGHPRLDLGGVALATAGLFALTWAVVRSGTIGWGAPAVVLPFVAALLLLGAFIVWERRSAHPMLPLAMFKSRNFSCANAISFCLYAGLFGSLFLMSQFFQSAEGWTPLATGAGLLIWSAWGILVAPLTARFAGRYGNRPFMLAGLALHAAALAGLALAASQDSSYYVLAPIPAISGIGISMVFPTVTGEAISSADPTQVGIASGTNNALRELGGVFGVAVLAGVFNRRGVYSDPAQFVAGFRSALWVAVAFTAAGIGLTALLRSRRPSAEPAGIAPERAQPELT